MSRQDEAAAWPCRLRLHMGDALQPLVGVECRRIMRKAVFGPGCGSCYCRDGRHLVAGRGVPGLMPLGLGSTACCGAPYHARTIGQDAQQVWLGAGGAAMTRRATGEATGYGQRQALRVAGRIATVIAFDRIPVREAA